MLKKETDDEKLKGLRPSTALLTPKGNTKEFLEFPDTAMYRPLSAGRVRASACRTMKKPKPPGMGETAPAGVVAAARAATASVNSGSFTRRKPKRPEEIALEAGPETLRLQKRRLYVQVNAAAPDTLSLADTTPRDTPEPTPQHARTTQRNKTMVNQFADIRSLASPQKKIGSPSWLASLQNQVAEHIHVDTPGDPSSPFHFIASIPDGYEDFSYGVQGSDSYHIKLVPHKAIPSSLYFTVSSRGVTRHDTDVTSFTPIKEWTEEYRLFKLTSSIPFFSQYRKWHIFKHWKKTVRLAAMHAAKEYLRANHVLLHPVLLKPIVDIRNLCREVSKLCMVRILTTSVSLASFSKSQKEQAKQCATVLKGKLQEINEITKEACKEALRMSLLARLDSEETSMMPKSTTDEMSQSRAVCRRLTGFIKLVDTIINDALIDFSYGALRDLKVLLSNPDEERDTDVLLSLMQASHMVTAKTIEVGKRKVLEENAKSAVIKKYVATQQPNQAPQPVKGRQKLSAMERAARKAWMLKQAKEGGDNLVNKLSAAGASIQALRIAGGGTAAEHDLEYTPVFSCTVVMGEKQGRSESDRIGVMAMSPGQEEYQDMVETVSAAVLKIVAQHEPLSTSDDFSNFIAAAADAHDDYDDTAAQSLDVVLSTDVNYVSLKNDIHNVIETGVRQVEGFMKEFNECSDIYTQIKSLSPVKIRKKDPPLQWYSSLFHSFHEQEEMIDHMVSARDVGVYTVSTEPLRDVLQPLPQEGLAKISKLLPLLTKEKNQVLLEELQQGVKQLTAEVHSIDGLAELIKNHEAVFSKMESYEQSYNLISDYLTFIEKEGIEQAPDDVAGWVHGTVPTFRRLKTSLTEAEERREEFTAKFSEVIDQDLSELGTRLNELQQKANVAIIYDEDADPAEVIAVMEDLAEQAQEIQKAERRLCNHQDFFGLDVTRLTKVVTVGKDIADKLRLWRAVSEWMEVTQAWATTPYCSASQQEMTNEINGYTKTVNQGTRSFPGNPVVLKLRTMVDEYKLILPILTQLTNPNLQEHHFEKINEIIGSNVTTDTCTLGTLLELQIVDVKEEIQVVSLTASQEAELEGQLAGIAKTWQEVEFTMVVHKDSGGKNKAQVIGALEPIILMLDDSNIALTTIITSRHCEARLKEKAAAWVSSLKTIGTTLEMWMECQKNWLYLESVYSHSDISRQWPTDARIFATTDKDMRARLKKVAESPYVHRSIMTHNIFSNLQSLASTFEMLLNSLNKNLDERRIVFPRFYFLSDADLIHLISHSKEPQSITRHLKSLFEGITKLHTDDDESIVGVESAEGEVLTFAKPLHTKKEAHRWMEKLEETVSATLKKRARECIVASSDAELDSWALGPHPVQLVLAVRSMVWCQRVEETLTNGTIGLGEVLLSCEGDLDGLANALTRELTSIQRLALTTLITLEVHHKQILNTLKDMPRDTDPMSFAWQRILRTYWDEPSRSIDILHLSHKYTYGYEYEGAASRLVVTPLTDRIFLTITASLMHSMGTSLTGPAGTGKTESVKDLARTIARQCVVYNCSPGVTCKMTTKFFAGLAQAGAWCCMDEINRISPAVLSSIAQQLHTVRTSFVNKIGSMEYMGNTISISNTFSVFVTMNKGYSCQTELPENMRTYFRPVAVQVPDTEMIAEVMLYANGFQDAENLSKKLVVLYKMCKQQLSNRAHYSFSIRDMKAVIEVAAMSRAGNFSDEAAVVKACLLFTLPKLHEDDVEVFESILQDIFQKAQVPLGNDKLKRPVVEALRNEGLNEILTEKILQFDNMLSYRHGVILLGQTGCGKTVSRQILAGIKGRQHVINPRSVSYGEMYGTLDPVSQQFTDGILATLVRSAVKSRPGNATHMEWLVFDGELNSSWMESLNTILDDSRVLCLVTGHRLNIGDYMKVVVEVDDVSDASPAVMTRCGVLHFTSLDWLPVVETWVGSLGSVIPSPMMGYLLTLFSSHFQKAVNFVNKNCTFTTETPLASLVSSTTAIFTAVISGKDLNVARDTAHQYRKLGLGETQQNIINLAFIYAVVWGVGGNLTAASQELFDGHMKEDLQGVLVCNGCSLYDQYPDLTQLRMVKWEERVLNSYASIKKQVVPVMDTVKYSHLTKLLVMSGRPVLVNGAVGVGKTTMVSSALEGTGLVLPVLITPSTSAHKVRDILESSLKAGPKHLMSRGDTAVVLLVDDVNMADPGATTPSHYELLRQLITYKGLHTKKKLEWKEVKHLIVAAVGCSQTSIDRVPQRAARLFTNITYVHPSEECMRGIVRMLLNKLFVERGFVKEVTDLTKPMAHGMVEVLIGMCDTFQKSFLKPYYAFSLHDLKAVVAGISQAVPRTCGSSRTATLLWIHEVTRCFCDKLSTPEDKESFTTVLMSALKRYFPHGSWKPDIFTSEWPLLFGDFLRPDAQKEDRVYEVIKEGWQLPVLFEYYTNELYDTSINVIFFKEACVHLTRMLRTMRQPGVISLFIGHKGTGKQLLTRIAAIIHEYDYFSLVENKPYSVEAFHTDLIQIYDTAALQGQHIVLMLTDSQVETKGILEEISYLLCGYEIPNVFSLEEIAKRTTAFMGIANIDDDVSQEEVWAQYMQLVRERVHITLCLTPGETFSQMCRDFPSLTSCCAIDWHLDWPAQALQHIASKLIQDLEPTATDTLSKDCALAHQSAVEICQLYTQERREEAPVAPCAYFEFLNLFTAVHSDRKRLLVVKREKIHNGLKKIIEANDVMKTIDGTIFSATEMHRESKEKAENLMHEVETRSLELERTKDVVSVKEAYAAEKRTAAFAIQQSAKAELDEAMPAIKSANKALASLSKQDIQELKSYSLVPKAVTQTIEAVMILLKEKKPNDWTVTRQIISRPDFLERLQSFDSDAIQPEVISKLERVVKDPDFTPDKVGQTGSFACRSLCIWAHAVYNYYHMEKRVAPKREQLIQAQEILNEANGHYTDAAAELRTVTSELLVLKATYGAARNEADELESKIVKSKQRFTVAEGLKTALEGQQEKWQEELQQIDIEVNNTLKASFLSAVTLTYGRGLTREYREVLREKWENICQWKGSFVLADHLTTPNHQREWVIAGLPSDVTSFENACCVWQCWTEKCVKWPLVIDPQKRAFSWLTKWLPKTEILKHPNSATSADAKRRFYAKIEQCIEIGFPCIITDVGEKLDPYLGPILQKKYVEEPSGSGMYRIQITEDHSVNYDLDFKLVLCCMETSPKFSNEVHSSVNVINFTAVDGSLDDQVLSSIVACKKPELEESMRQNLTSIAGNKKLLAGYEEQLLAELENSGQDLLANSMLIQNLQKLKQTTHYISKQLSEAEAAKQEIKSLREGYKPVADLVSRVYHIASRLRVLSPFYAFSFEFIINIANKAIRAKQDVALQLYKYITQALQPSHRLTFALLLATTVDRFANELTESDVHLLYKLPILAVEFSQLPVRPPWITAEVWGLLNVLQKHDSVGNLARLCRHIISNSDEWMAWASAGIVNPPPLKGISAYQTFLISHCFGQGTVAAGWAYVKTVLGEEYASSEGEALKKVVTECGPRMPVLFVISSNVDPLSAVMRLAEECGIENVQEISAGVGVSSLIKTAAQTNTWLFIHNVHLLDTFQFFQQLADSETEASSQFRLFLTTQSSQDLPVHLIEQSVKYSFSSETGIKSTMQREFWERVIPVVDDEYSYLTLHKTLVFSLCAFHAVVVERCKYGSLGWSSGVTFDDSDLSTSLAQIELLFERASGSMDWHAVTYIVGHINYGGRTGDPSDLNVITSLAQQFISKAQLGLNPLKVEDNTYAEPPPCDYVAHDSMNCTGLSEEAFIERKKMESRVFLESVPCVLQGLGKRAPTVDGAEVMKICETIAKGLPATFDVAKAETNIVRNEMTRYNELLKRVRDDTEMVKEAVQGTAMVTSAVQRTIDRLMRNALPEEWLQMSFCTLDGLVEWVRGLKKRCEYFRNGTKSNVYWIPAYYQPVALCADLLQSYARRNNAPLTDVVLKFSVGGLGSMTVTGLRAVGCAWDASVGALSPGASSDPFPPLTVTATEASPLDPEELCVVLPVYLHPNRHVTTTRGATVSTMVFEVTLPCSCLPEKLILAGAALVAEQ